MNENKLKEALAAIVEDIKKMSPEQFLAEIRLRTSGDFSRAMVEIQSVASEFPEYRGVFIIKHSRRYKWAKVDLHENSLSQCCNDVAAKDEECSNYALAA